MIPIRYRKRVLARRPVLKKTTTPECRGYICSLSAVGTQAFHYMFSICCTAYVTNTICIVLKTFTLHSFTADTHICSVCALQVLSGV